MKRIVLSFGKFAMVSDADFDRLSAWQWSAIRPKQSGGTWYAGRRPGKRHSRKLILMHRFILGANRGQLVDHEDGNGLNNCRENIRVATASQNNMNSRKRAGCSSRYKGVHFDSKRGMWRAEIYCGGKRSRLGWFTSEKKAATAYDAAASDRFGRFAKLNIVRAA